MRPEYGPAIGSGDVGQARKEVSNDSGRSTLEHDGNLDKELID